MNILKRLFRAIFPTKNRSIQFSQRLAQLNEEFPDGMAILMHELYNAHMRRIVFNFGGVVPKEEKRRIEAICKKPFQGLNEKQQAFFAGIAVQLPGLFDTKAQGYADTKRKSTPMPPENNPPTSI